MLDEYADEYQILAERSEALYDRQQAYEAIQTDTVNTYQSRSLKYTKEQLANERDTLKRAYEKLDSNTGLTDLFARLAKLKENQ